MKFYKLIKNNDFIGISTSNSLKKYNSGSGLFLSASYIDAEFISVNYKLYRDTWMQPVPDVEVTYETVHIIEITEEEYMQLVEINTQQVEVRQLAIQEFIPQE